jgi:cytochrome c-type biogenesis protein CcmE
MGFIARFLMNCQMSLVAPFASGTAILAATLLLVSSGIVVHAHAQSVQTSYSVAKPSVIAPMTLQLENHLYQPGDEVKLKGLVWSDIMKNVKGLNTVKIELKDIQGKVLTQQNATVQSDGAFEASLGLLAGASPGVYSAQASVGLGADSLGIVQKLTSSALRSSINFVVASAPTIHDIKEEGRNFPVSIASNSDISGVELNKQAKKLAFTVNGQDGTLGVSKVTIPKELLSGDMTVLIDGSLTTDVLQNSTTDATTLEINYKHSTHKIEVAGTNVVSEFPYALITMAIALGTTAGAFAVFRARMMRY